MPTPTTKEALLNEIRTEREALEKFLAGLVPQQMVQPGAIAAWSVKDVLAHLAEWEQLLLVWYQAGLQAGLRGEDPPLPAPGYTWAQMDDLNQEIFEKYRAAPLERVLDYFRSSYSQVLGAVQAMAQDELFTPGRYAWTKQNTLADYVIPCTSEHYEWARREMLKGLKKEE
jgi:uncharacterized protein (TIGR03083 family)